MDFNEEFERVLEGLAREMALPPASDLPGRKALTLGDFEIRFVHGDGDPEAFHIHFDFGISTAGRTLTVYRLMLEANVLIYAQDEAQMGLDNATGAVLLLVRVSLLESVDVQWLADTLLHYIEHGNYWRDKIMQAPDAMFIGIGNGDYEWIRI